MRLRISLMAMSAVLIGYVEPDAAAGTIPYGPAGTYNATTYTFTATTTGDVVAYFAGTPNDHPLYEIQLGLWDNGVLTSAGYGLDNRTSTIGESFDLGSVHAGDQLVLVFENLTLGLTAYSDPSLNTAYDLPDDNIGHNHIYATDYTASPPLFGARVPAGTYVGFEDGRIPGADFNYTDATFVVTNLSTPEPSSLILAGLGVVILGAGLRRARRKACAAGRS